MNFLQGRIFENRLCQQPLKGMPMQKKTAGSSTQSRERLQMFQTPRCLSGCWRKEKRPYLAIVAILEPKSGRCRYKEPLDKRIRYKLDSHPSWVKSNLSDHAYDSSADNTKNDPFEQDESMSLHSWKHNPDLESCLPIPTDGEDVFCGCLRAPRL